MRNDRSRSRHYGVRWAAVIAASALAVAACGGDDDEETTGGADATETATETATPTATESEAPTATEGGTSATASEAPETETAAGDPLAGSSFSFLAVVTESGDSAYQKMVDLYLEAYPERSIDYEEIAGPQYGQLLRTRYVGGNPPDIAYVTPGYGNDQALLSLAEAGFLEPLTGTAAESTISDNVRQTFELNGEIYGQALNLTIVATVANATALETDAVTVPDDFAGLLEACSAIAENGKSMYVVAGSAPPNTGLFAMNVAASRVYAETPDWNAQRAAGEVTFADTPGWVQTMDDIAAMNEAGCFQEGVVAGDFAAITNGIATGNSYSAFIPAGAAFGLVAEAPESFFDVRPMPGATADSTLVFASPNDALAISADSSDEAKAAAKAFLEWLAMPENLAEVGAVQGWLPPVGVDPAALPPQFAPVGDFLASGRYAPLPNAGWQNPEVYSALGVGIQGLLSGQASGADVLASMDEAWDS